MKGHIIILHANGKTPSLTYTHKAPSLEVLQAAVGGHIELVPMFDQYQGHECVVFCNEEGKLEGLPVNEAASLAWADCHGGYIDDLLCGDIAIVQGDEDFLAAL